MKIKQLHLRNIASIEKADIDFDRDIQDLITGEPASIFLISGDTGTGKSIILDGISLALYKKTPRLVGVAGKTNNDYTNSEGESISINSIEQYTRLGISEKDDCYSELVFEGNDGRLYRARLELGLLRGNKDENGHRPLKHRSPKWTVQVEGEDWQRVEAKTGQPILNAVGLSFEQFGRMAMLAQGQFASFLTGDKAEREQILEQLTCTERFSLYGKAITNLFNAAKTRKASAQAAFDTEKAHILAPEQVQALRDNQLSLNTEKNGLETEQKHLQTTLDTLSAITTCRQDILQQEQLLHAAVQQQTTLLETAATAAQQVEQQRGLVRIDEEAINVLLERRNALYPAQLSADIKQFTMRRTLLENLRTRMTKAIETQHALEANRQAIEQQLTELSAYQNTYDLTQKEYEEALQKERETYSLLSTMQMSLQDTLTALRRRLQDTHADTCPLCGQQIIDLHTDGDFQRLLTPLQQREQEAAALLQAATSKRDQARRQLDLFRGGLQSKQQAYTRATADLQAENQAMTAQAEALFGPGTPLQEDTLTQAIAQANTHLATLEEQQNRAEALQVEINALLLHKRPLDAALAQAERAALIAKNNAETNSRESSRIEQLLTSLRTRTSQLIASLPQPTDTTDHTSLPDTLILQTRLDEIKQRLQTIAGQLGIVAAELATHEANMQRLRLAEDTLSQAGANYDKWERLHRHFGGTRLRTLVQTYILRPLLANANVYLSRITDRYTLTCSEDNEQLAILVLDRYHRCQVRSVTVLSGGERFMISLALSLALSSLNRQDMCVNILFIDEGFGTLDETNLNAVMSTLERLQEIAGQSNRRVGIISHREELVERIPVQIRLVKCGEGRSHVQITQE